MSDFLTRLAARQLGTMETIQPRVKPLCAPAAPDSQTLAVLDEEISPPPRRSDDSPAIPPAAPQTAQRDTPTASATDKLRMEAAGFEDHRGDSDRRMERGEGESLAGPRERGERGIDVARESISTTAKMAGATAPITIQRLAVEKSTRSDSSSNDRAPFPSVAKSEFAPMPLVHSTHEKSAKREVPSAPAPLSIHKDRVDEAAAKTTAPAPVHVTIGRIEVTAVTRAAPAKRAAPARKPAPSLDDYLARRRGRER
ncbi:MAG TPA: hypothetical protein VF208_13050 [Candidatus Binatia bacterium]